MRSIIEVPHEPGIAPIYVRTLFELDEREAVLLGFVLLDRLSGLRRLGRLVRGIIDIGVVRKGDRGHAVSSSADELLRS